MTSHLPERPSLDGSRYDVVIIGGGINGVAIARECALAGKRTVLLEQHDFGSGTTSRSTRIIHGGLRYLEHGELGLVRESLRARGELLRERPHLVRPLQFVLALDGESRRSPIAIGTGLWLYRTLGGAGRNQKQSGQEERQLQRSLDTGRRWSLFQFEDAQCEFPELLVAEWLMEATAAGAVARSYTSVLEVRVVDGRARGVRTRDLLSGQEEEVAADWVINATGPWADRVCGSSSVRLSAPLIGGVRGSHIVLPRFAGAPTAAVYSEATDGRPMFVIPWNEQILVGSTEVRDSEDPAKTAPSASEVEYLMASFLRLFPRAAVGMTDIRYAFAGVRPLPFTAETDLGAVSRHHFLHDHAPEGAAGMISVIGGKLTTAAELARECAVKIGVPRRNSRTDYVFSGEAPASLLDEWVSQCAAASGLNAETVHDMVDWHGRRASEIAHLARTDERLRAPLCEHTTHIVAEAAYAYAKRWAVSLGDVLLRRVPVAWSGCWEEVCGRTAAARIGAVMGWSDLETGKQLEAFETERAAMLRKPSS